VVSGETEWGQSLLFCDFLLYIELIKLFQFFLINILKALSFEFKINFSPIYSPGHTHWAISLFLIIILNNVAGLSPYTFTSSRHLSFSIRLALVRWIRYILYRFFIDFNKWLAHLVPVGTPYILIPFIVLIELIRNLIRPLTLSVRLAANLVAGHLLITLVRFPIPSLKWELVRLTITGLILLLILETAVAFIQAYVFSILRTLYLREVNNTKFNYLCNYNIKKLIYIILIKNINRFKTAFSIINFQN